MWQKIKNLSHLSEAVFANIFYMFPSKSMKIIGVTGTDGKTTTVSLIYNILKSSGYKVSLASSIGAIINGKKYDTGFHVTTPNPLALQKLLRRAADLKTEYFVLEVTSHALDQFRVWGIPFEVGVITNITNEHLDYHKTYERYLKTKQKLIDRAKIAVVNLDDSSYSLLAKSKNKKAKGKWITYGLSDEAKINLKDLPHLKFHEQFNEYNILASIAACRSLGVDENILKKSLLSYKMPMGRMDCVYHKDFRVIIDFAHTPNAFKNVLSSLRPKVKGRLIHVFGSAGERDRYKRPELGKISSVYSNVIVLTAEDPRGEDVNAIIDEIAQGIKNNRVKVYKLHDRKNAIDFAVDMAKRNDLVLITGKSHEKSMNYGHGEEPWDEFKVVDEALKKKYINKK